MVYATTLSNDGSPYHVFGLEYLLGEFEDGKSAILLGTAGGEGSEIIHEEMETGEGDEVESKLSKFRIELIWEPETAGETSEGGRDEIVKITKSGVVSLKLLKQIS